jgi:hypothetical protein
MIHPRKWLVAFLFLTVGYSSAGECQADSVLTEVRVRVHHRSHAIRSFAGVLVRSTQDTLYLVPDGSASPEPVALADIRRLQRSIGKKSNLWRGVGIGAIIGSAAGLAVGLAEPVLEEGAEASAAIPAATALVGALAGGIAGGLIGSMSRGERWEPMVWVQRGAPDATRSSRTVGTWLGIGLRLSVAGERNSRDISAEFSGRRW